MLDKLSLVYPSMEYKEAAIDYINEHLEYSSPINGVGGLNRYLSDYEGWLEKLDEDKNIKPNEERVPSLSYFLVRESDNKIIGMINIRLCLNESLRKCGGHIGYGIRPSERRKGYNKINLYLALKVCQSYGIKEVYLDCDKSNLGSAKSMQALGGILQEEYYEESMDCMCQKYAINVSESVKKYQKKYE